ncbi:MAG: 2Fe-2S iron-sulfur cluster-binding protein [Bacillota bacterium]
MQARLKVFRFDPDRDGTSRHQVYQIPWSEGLSVLEALRYIYEHLDGSLAFRNYHCGRGLCASCLMSINGQNKRSCHFLVSHEEEVTVEPASGYPIIRDLVVDFGIPRPEGSVRDGVTVHRGAVAE